MANIKKSIKIVFIEILYSIASKLLMWFEGIYGKIKLKQLRNQLFQCGENCFVQWPAQITGRKFVSFGNDVTVASFVHIWGDGGVFIGDRVMIASHTAITSLTHDYNCVNMHKTLIKRQVIINDDVWIGAHSIIMPGVTIGEGSVVGAGSVVTRDVAPYSIVIGVPAREVKKREIQEDISV